MLANRRLQKQGKKKYLLLNKLQNVEVPSRKKTEKSQGWALKPAPSCKATSREPGHEIACKGCVGSSKNGDCCSVWCKTLLHKICSSYCGCRSWAFSLEFTRLCWSWHSSWHSVWGFAPAKPRLLYIMLAFYEHFSKAKAWALFEHFSGIFPGN